MSLPLSQLSDSIRVEFFTPPFVATDSPIRITYVIPTLDQSGAERQLTQLATNLPQSDVDVRVIALNRGGHYARLLADAGIPVDVLEKRFRFDPLTYVRLRRLLHKQQPDIVQSFLFAANSYVRLPGITPPRSKIVVSERCVDSWKSGWQKKVDGWLAPKMDAMTANSSSVADFYASTVGIDRSRISVIPNGVDLPAVPTPSDDGSSNLRRELNLPDHAKLVGFVGRLAPQKCLDDLMWAFQLLHQVVDDAYLIIAGDGPEREHLAGLMRSFGCRDKVFFLGHREDATAITGQLNAFCLPSSFEGMSNSLMDAMAAGVPVVVSDIPSNTELIEHDRNGLVVPLGKGPDITRACKKILTEPESAERLGKAGRQTIEEHHSVNQLVQRHMDLYHRLTT